MSYREFVGNAATGKKLNPDSKGVIIAHVCNDAGLFGAGFAYAIAKKYPVVKNQYADQYQRYLLGQNQYVPILNNLVVCNMFAQKGVRSHLNPVPLQYGKLINCLTYLYCEAKEKNFEIHMPKIGSGLAGGDWWIIQAAVKMAERLSSVDTFVFSLE